MAPRPGRPIGRTRGAPQPAPVRRGPGRPFEGDTDDTRLRILMAALETFAAHGYSNGKLRTIAERADVTLGTVTHHFPTKRELFLLAHEQAAKLLVDGFGLVLAELDTLAEEIQAMLDRSARFMRDQPALTRLLIRAITDRSHPDLHPLRFAAPLDHFIDGITERAIARGEIGPSDGDELRYLLRAMLWGLSIVGVDDRTRRSASIRGFQRLFAGDLLKDHGAGPGAARRPAVARSS